MAYDSFSSAAVLLICHLKGNNGDLSATDWQMYDYDLPHGTMASLVNHLLFQFDEVCSRSFHGYCCFLSVLSFIQSLAKQACNSERDC